MTITQNCSYIGRCQMPDRSCPSPSISSSIKCEGKLEIHLGILFLSSLRVLFRPVSLISPDWKTIAEVKSHQQVHITQKKQKTKKNIARVRNCLDITILNSHFSIFVSLFCVLSTSCRKLFLQEVGIELPRRAKKV